MTQGGHPGREEPHLYPPGAPNRPLGPPPRAAPRLIRVTGRRPRTADPACWAPSGECLRPSTWAPAQHARPADRPCTRRRVGLRLAWMGHRRRGPYLAAPPREPARGVESTFLSHRHIYISFFYPSSHRLHKHLHSHALAEVASFF